jgi:hypothetical protein
VRRATSLNDLIARDDRCDEALVDTALTSKI